MNFLVRFAHREYSPLRRFITLLGAGVVILGLVPAGFIGVGRWLDGMLGLPACFSPPYALVVGGLLILSGYPLALWAVYVQFTAGRGTPIPTMPTQRLITHGPYRYCRNPMALGTTGLYLGMVCLARSPAAAVIVLLLMGALFVYNKQIEEAEMEARFGEAYRAYKQRTPFLCPSLRRRAPRDAGRG